MSKELLEIDTIIRTFLFSMMNSPFPQPLKEPGLGFTDILYGVFFAVVWFDWFLLRSFTKKCLCVELEDELEPFSTCVQ